MMMATRLKRATWRGTYICWFPILCDVPADAGGEDHDDDEAGEGDMGGPSAGQQEGYLGEASLPLDAAQEAKNLSAHERRMQRMAERARRLEEQNVGEKEWFMRGEADSGNKHPLCPIMKWQSRLIFCGSGPKTFVAMAQVTTVQALHCG